jgi:hypothetical protein
MGAGGGGAGSGVADRTVCHRALASASQSSARLGTGGDDRRGRGDVIAGIRAGKDDDPLRQVAGGEQRDLGEHFCRQHRLGDRSECFQQYDVDREQGTPWPPAGLSPGRCPPTTYERRDGARVPGPARAAARLRRPARLRTGAA